LIFSLAVALVLAAVIFLSSLNLIPSIVAERFSGIADYFGVFDVRGVKVDDANYAIVERMAHWQAALEMFADSPWLGVGFGNYTVAYPRYALPHWDDPLGHAHNYLLNVAAESGVIGASAYVLLWGAAFWQGWRAVRGARGLSRPLAAGLLGMLVGLTVHNTFDNLFVHSMQIQVGIGFGIVAWLNRVR
jgi:O-antigen ligase